MKKKSEPQTAPAKRLRLLIIDDSPTLRQTLSRLPLLVPSVEIVGEAENGIEGLKLLRDLRPDVITLDIQMPEMGGIEMLRAIKAAGKTCAIIVMTAVVDPTYREECRSLGADHVFDKTTDFRKFVEVLRSMHPTTP